MKVTSADVLTIDDVVGSVYWMTFEKYLREERELVVKKILYSEPENAVALRGELKVYDRLLGLNKEG